MLESKVFVNGNNGKRINLPKAIWSKLGLSVGDHVEFIVQKNGKVLIRKKGEN